MASLRAELVADLRSFQALRTEWNDLVEQMEYPEIFYRWEWNYHYFRRFREGDRLFVIVIRDGGGDIVGIAPLCIQRKTRLLKAVRVATTIVVDIGDYQNILVHRSQHRHGVVAAVFRYLSSASAAWDVIDLAELCARDPTTTHILNEVQAHRDWTVRIQFLTAVALRNFKWGRIAENRRQVVQVRNRLARLRARGFRFHIGCRDFERLWPDFRALHLATWRTGTFHDEKGRLFFDDLRGDCGLAGSIEFSYVEHEGRPVAMHFGFVDLRKVYFYMPAMDRSLRTERVGAALLYAMIEHYSGKVDTFDFLRGLEAYKTWYTDDLEMNIRFVISRSFSIAALAYNLPEVTRRYAMELGWPTGIVRMGRALKKQHQRH
jgi:CelD/BcsL family acetyltransferase involved in cellulose biosynthesis